VPTTIAQAAAAANAPIEKPRKSLRPGLILKPGDAERNEWRGVAEIRADTLDSRPGAGTARP